PSAFYICQKLLRWYRILEQNYETVSLKEFQSAEAIVPTLITPLPICYKDKLTSKLLNFKNLSEPINSSFIPPLEVSNHCDSASLDFSISDECDNDI
ncbi:4886_t:CDS:2, partial [Gigaspora rosea]